MKDELRESTVREFALETEENLRNAFAVEEALPGIRAAVVSDFMRVLSRSLRDGLPKGWIVSDPTDFFEEEWGQVTISKERWRGCYTVALQGRRYSRDGLTVGVWRDGDRVRGAPDSRIKEAFQAKGWPGKSDTYHEWHYELPAEYGRIRDVEAIVRMKFHSKQTLKYFTGWLDRVRHIAEPLVDRLCKG
jgi:hypothetical protein